jgi:hypothetical protein
MTVAQLIGQVLEMAQSLTDEVIFVYPDAKHDCYEKVSDGDVTREKDKIFITLN